MNDKEKQVIKIGDSFMDKWGRKYECIGFGGNLAHTMAFDKDGLKTNDYGISSEADLIEYEDGRYINYGNIKEIPPPVEIIKR